MLHTQLPPSNPKVPGTGSIDINFAGMVIPADPDYTTHEGGPMEYKQKPAALGSLINLLDYY